MANPSLQIGNGKFAIKENELLGYSSSGTRFFPIPITMTRATLGTRVNPSGLVEDVALLGSDLASGYDFTSGWYVFGGGTTITNSTSFVSQSGQGIYAGLGIVANKTYKIKITGTQPSGGYFSIKAGTTGTSFGNINGTSFNETIYATPTVVTGVGNDFYIRLSSHSAGTTITITDLEVQEATLDGLARVDYTDGTGSLLVEPQRTNLITYSEDLSVLSKVSVGTASAPVTTSNYATAPDGTQTATRVVFDLNGGTSSGDRSILRQAIPSGSNYYFSIYVKSTDGTEQNILWHDGGEYNLTTVTNEWVRITYDGRPNLVFSGIALRGGDGVDSSDILAWGFQVEEGSYPTSYIKTQGSSVTRNQDEYIKTGISDKINSEEGVLFVEAKTIYDSSTSRRISLSDGSINNRVLLEFDETTENTIKAVITTGAVNSAIMTFAASDLSQYNKIAIKYKLNDFSIWFNGTEVVTDSSGGVPTGLTQLVLDGGDGSNFFYGEVKQLQVFKTALSDSELATLTT